MLPLRPTICCSAPSVVGALLRHRALVSGTILLICFVFGACVGRTGAHIELVIPRDLTGLIAFIEDEKRGEDVAVSLPIFYVPTNGVLRLKTLEPFQRFHILTARYFGEDVVIPQGDLHDPPEEFEFLVKLYALGSSSGRVYYFLGTKKQAGQAHRNFSKIESGKF